MTIKQTRNKKNSIRQHKTSNPKRDEGTWMNDLGAAARVLHDNTRLRRERDNNTAALDIATVQRVRGQHVDVLFRCGDSKGERTAGMIGTSNA